MGEKNLQDKLKRRNKKDLRLDRIDFNISSQKIIKIKILLKLLRKTKVEKFTFIFHIKTYIF